MIELNEHEKAMLINMFAMPVKDALQGTHPDSIDLDDSIVYLVVNKASKECLELVITAYIGLIDKFDSYLDTETKTRLNHYKKLCQKVLANAKVIE